MVVPHFMIILVGGKDFEDHRRNLTATLQRCQEKGITLKLKKINFCKREVTWFGRIFSACPPTLPRSPP